jgi:flagellar hook-associated protein 3 FlgL
MNQSARDGVYNVTTSATPTNRAFQTSPVTLSSAAAVTGLGYQLSITGVDSTTVPGTTTVTYDITEDPSGAATVLSSVSASYPSNQAASIAVTGIPGLSITLKGAPAVGDTVTIDPSASLFSVLDDAIAGIGNAANGNAAGQAVAQALNNLDIGASRVASVRGQAGDLLNRADRISANQDKRSIQLESDRSRAEDLDMTKGISEFQNQQTGYQAALQSYAQIQKISLFNYIG